MVMPRIVHFFSKHFSSRTGIYLSQMSFVTVTLSLYSVPSWRRVSEQPSQLSARAASVTALRTAAERLAAVSAVAQIPARRDPPATAGDPDCPPVCRPLQHRTLLVCYTLPSSAENRCH